MRIAILRHGETRADQAGRFEGHSDSPLTNEGEQQVRRIAEALRDEHYDIIHSSPLKRALDSAKLLSQQLKVDVRIVPELQALCYGDWEEQAREDMDTTDEQEQRTEDTYNFTYPGEYDGTPGQSHADIYPRIEDYFNRLSETDEDNVIVITHDSVIRNAKLYFEDIPERDAVEFILSPKSRYVVTLNDGPIETAVVDV
jgi:broad specificity phosphatase PhoE